MIVDVQGTTGGVRQSVPVQAQTVNNTVRLKYFHFPDLPLLDEFVEALTVNSVKFTVPASSSIADIVNALDGFVQGVNRVCYCWYSGTEFEICAGTQNIELSTAFAAALKLPELLTANACYSSSLFESSVSLYSHFAVQVGGARGHWSNNEYDSVIAKVRRDMDVSATNSHYFRLPVNTLEISVLAVKRDGTSTTYSSPEIWGLGLELV